MHIKTTRSGRQKFFVSQKKHLATLLTAIALVIIILAALPAIADTASYIFNPGDIISVKVMNHPEFSVDQAVITPDSRINLPVAGEMTAAGKTLKQLENEIANALQKRLADPEVSVIIVQTAPQRIFVLGAVRKPGVYDWKPGWRVTEALASAGGLLSRPELTAGLILRQNKQSIALDIQAVMNGSNNANLEIHPGDVVNLTERTIKVSIAGQVKSPGTYDLPIGAGVVEAVAMAGGAQPKAALTAVKVKRADGSIIPLDLFKVMVKGEITESYQVSSGDLIVLPQSIARIAVLGAVQKPGYYDIEDGAITKLSDAVAMAGGTAKHARIAEIGVIRQNNGKQQRIIINLDSILRQGKTDQDITIKNGDIIYIPDAKVDWDLILRGISSIGVLRWFFD
jgi:polysaccharide export outer membrane protein